MKDFHIPSKKAYFALLAIAILLFGLDYKVRADTSEPKVLAAESSVVSEYPILRVNINPILTAKGAVVMDADSGVVLYSKNSNLRFSSASTAKIMTAITALDRFGLKDIFTVKNATSEGVILGLKEGQKITFENILYGLLLPSANDAAFVIAQNYGPNFVDVMNRNAVKLNLYNTHYQDPAGLEDDGDYTTPLDLARLSGVAIKNEIFSKIVATREKTIVDESGENYSVKNLNKLLGVDGVFGVKTGTTAGAGQVLVTSKKEGSHTIIIVVMGSQDRFSDTTKLINLISGNITYLSIHL